METSQITVSGLRVGLVEDEPDLQLIIRYNLEPRGFDVESMERGDEAEAMLRDSHFDLLILDWMLPGLSGIGLLRRLRRQAATRSLPIIVLTARTSEGDLIRAFETGADDFSRQTILGARVAGASRSAFTPPRSAENCASPLIWRHHI